MLTKKSFWIILSIIVIIITVVIFITGKPKQQYTIITPTIGPISNEIMASATIVPKIGALINVGARISGTVEKLNVSVGDYIKKGDLIAVIQHNDIEQQIAQIKSNIQSKIDTLKQLIYQRNATLSNLKGQLVQALNTLSYKKSDFESNRILYEKGFISRNVFDNLKVGVKNTEENVKSLQKQLASQKMYYKFAIASTKEEIASLKHSLNQKKIQLSYAFIRAPISGYIVSVSTQKGETVASSFNTPTFVTIVNLKKLELQAMVSDSDIASVKVGDPVYFYLDAYPNKKLHAIVDKIYPNGFLQDQVTYYYVDCKLIDSTVKFKPQMNANAYIVTAIHKKVLILPAYAVKFSGTKSFVYEYINGKIVKHFVKVGFEENGKIEITSGINENGKIIVYEKNTPKRNF